MNLKRAALIFALVLSCSLAVQAQEAKCTLKSAQLHPAPELFGLRLGMTVEEVRAIVPTLVTEKPDEFGMVSTSVNPEFDNRIKKSTFEGVRTLSFEFLDGRLLSLGIGYRDSFKWQSMDEFLSGIAEALGLPNSWETGSMGRRQVACDGFTVTAKMIGGSPSLNLNDAAARELWEKRRAEKADAQP